MDKLNLIRFHIYSISCAVLFDQWIHVYIYRYRCHIAFLSHSRPIRCYSRGLSILLLILPGKDDDDDCVEFIIIDESSAISDKA